LIKTSLVAAGPDVPFATSARATRALRDATQRQAANALGLSVPSRLLMEAELIE